MVFLALLCPLQPLPASSSHRLLLPDFPALVLLACFIFFCTHKELISISYEFGGSGP